MGSYLCCILLFYLFPYGQDVLPVLTAIDHAVAHLANVLDAKTTDGAHLYGQRQVGLGVLGRVKGDAVVGKDT